MDRGRDDHGSLLWDDWSHCGKSLLCNPSEHEQCISELSAWGLYLLLKQ
jgi:hypothetical protein